MGNKTKIKKVRSLIISPVIRFFSLMRRTPIAKLAGYALYRTGLDAALNLLGRYNEIIAVYSKSRFSGDFVPGVSDIDLVIITKNLSIESEIIFLKKIYLRWALVYALIPFIAPLQIYSHEEFEKHMKNNLFARKGKHFSEWELVFGKEIRTFNEKPNKISRYVLRRAFEDLLLNIYESWIYGENYLRRAYKSAHDIFLTEYLLARWKGDFKQYILSKTNDYLFTKTFFDIPKKDYAVSKEMQIKILYYSIKTLENLLLKVNDTKFEERISCKIPIKNDLEYIYFIEEFEDYMSFKKSIGIFLEKVRHISKFRETLDKKPKSRFGADFKVFPLIVSNNLMNSLFLDSLYPFESIAVMNIKKQKSKGTIEQLKESFEGFKDNHMRDRANSLLYRTWLEGKKEKEELIEYTMAYRLLKEKNKVCFKNIESEYKRSFKDINLVSDKPEHKYSFIRRIIKK